MKEQRVTRAIAQTMVSDIMRAIASGAGQSVVQFGGVELVVERGGDDTATVRASDQSESARFYLPSPVAPPDYPSSLPFIPNEPLMLSRSSLGVLTLIWWAPREPEALFETLARDSSSSDWIDVESKALPPSNVLQRSFVKDRSQRRLMVSDGIVSLFETNNRSPAK